jgi:hypothetical protein
MKGKVKNLTLAVGDNRETLLYGFLVGGRKN